MANISIKIESKTSVVEFGVTKLPDRQNPCLYKMRGAILEPLAYFRCQEDADSFNRILELLLEWGGNDGHR